MLRQILVLNRWRLGRRWLSSAGYSASWRSIDHEEEEDERVLRINPPDPLEYLQGFDAVPQVLDFKQALLEACDLQKGDRLLDIGCGTATHFPQYADKVGTTGQVTGIDISSDMIQRAQQHYANFENILFQTANIYDLPFASHSFDCVKEDRVLEHLHRPLEAVEEMRRVTTPGGLVVVSNPDFRSFQMDIVRQRWDEKRRPPTDLDFDLFSATTKLLGGIIPTLASHTDMGLSQPRLLKAAGLRNIEMKICPIPLIGRQSLEAIVPITFMAQCSVENGAISDDERNRWLARLEWEGDDNLFGVLNMYICRGVKPSLVEDDASRVQRERPSFGTPFFPGWSPKPKHDVRTEFATPDIPASMVEQIKHLINSAYNVSDTGITLSSQRVQFHHVQEMVERGEILIALDESTGEILGCLQVQVKTKESSNPNSQGYALDEDEERLAEFTCFAVRSDGKRGRGVGAALVRASESYARSRDCPRMQIAILCPAEYEPEYKQWLQTYYLGLGYEHKTTQYLRFQKDEQGNVVEDELHELYDPLHQLVAFKAIIMEKML